MPVSTELNVINKMIKNTVLIVVGLLGFSILVGLSYDKSDSTSFAIGVIGIISLIIAAINIIFLLIKIWKKYCISKIEKNQNCTIKDRDGRKEPG